MTQTPTIYKKFGLDEAASCEGSVVVIDVLRAFTTAAFCFHQGARDIFLVSTAEESFALKKRNPNFVLIGEDRGRKIEGFEFGNSPETISQISLDDKTIVLRSSSGTQGVIGAQSAKHIFLGSLVVAKATMEHLMARAANPISLLAMGSPFGPENEEDVACADYMESLLLKQALDKEKVIQTVRECPAGKIALDPNIDFISPGDLRCATEIDKFGFAMPVFREGPHLIARPLAV